MLKFKYAAQDDVPEGMLEFYKEANGEFILQVEGGPSPAEIDRLKRALGKERDEHKATKAALTKFGDLDPEDVTSRLAELEDLNLKVAAGEVKPNDGKVAELIRAAEARVRGPLDRKIQQLQDEVQQRENVVAEVRAEMNRSKIAQAVARAASKAEVVQSALEDAQFLAERVMEVTADGEIVTRDGVGCTPGLDPASWINELKEKRPHWWPASKGGGARGGSGGGGSGAAILDDNGNFNMTKFGQVAREQGIDKANQMARQAGFDQFGRPVRKTGS